MVLGALQIRATMAGRVQRVVMISHVIVLLNGRGKSAQQVGNILLLCSKLIASLMKGACW